MNSISRAVSSKINELSNKRQRLVGQSEKDAVSHDTSHITTNPSWTDPTTSDFNYFEPPFLVIPEEDWRETPIMQQSPEKPTTQKSPHGNISKKVSSVVRKLSPFGSKDQRDDKERPSEIDGENQMEEKKRLFKETRGKMDKLKKSFKGKDREQLIESEEEDH